LIFFSLGLSCPLMYSGSGVPPPPSLRNDYGRIFLYGKSLLVRISFGEDPSLAGLNSWTPPSESPTDMSLQRIPNFFNDLSLCLSPQVRLTMFFSVFECLGCPIQWLARFMIALVMRCTSPDSLFFCPGRAIPVSSLELKKVALNSQLVLSIIRMSVSSFDCPDPQNLPMDVPLPVL